MWLDVDRMVAEMDSFRRRMDDLFELFEDSRRELLGVSPFEERYQGWGTLEATVFDNGDSYSIEVEVPGVDPKDVTLDATAGGVTIAAERKTEVPDKARLHRHERTSWKLSRSFSLPLKIDADKAEAQFKNGLLVVKLPKAAEAQPRRIEVKA